jgi:hypothetical protein
MVKLNNLILLAICFFMMSSCNQDALVKRTSLESLFGKYNAYLKGYYTDEDHINNIPIIREYFKLYQKLFYNCPTLNFPPVVNKGYYIRMKSQYNVIVKLDSIFECNNIFYYTEMLNFLLSITLKNYFSFF